MSGLLPPQCTLDYSLILHRKVLNLCRHPSQAPVVSRLLPNISWRWGQHPANLLYSYAYVASPPFHLNDTRRFILAHSQITKVPRACQAFSLPDFLIFPLTRPPYTDTVGIGSEAKRCGTRLWLVLLAGSTPALPSKFFPLTLPSHPCYDCNSTGDTIWKCSTKDNE